MDTSGMVDALNATIPHRARQENPMTASNKARLIRMAADLPKGDEKRRAILTGLKTAASVKSVEAELAKAVEEAGLGPKDQMGMKGRTLWLADGKGEVLIYDTTARGTVLNYKGKEYRTVKDLMRSL